MGDPAYCLDTTLLIDINNHFPSDIKHVGKLAKRGRVKIPAGVCRELHKVDDDLFPVVNKWVEKSGAGIDIYKSDPKVKNLFGEIQRKYGEDFQLGTKVVSGFFKSKRGKKSADAEVVTIGKFFGLVAVSDDTAVKSACMLEGVECITWQEFRRRFNNFLNNDDDGPDLFSGTYRAE